MLLRCYSYFLVSATEIIIDAALLLMIDVCAVVALLIVLEVRIKGAAQGKRSN